MGCSWDGGHEVICQLSQVIQWNFALDTEEALLDVKRQPLVEEAAEPLLVEGLVFVPEQPLHAS